MAGDALKKRLEALRKAGADVPAICAAVARGATIAAVNVTVNATPPNGAEIKGVNTRSGNMARHWVADSITTPKKVGHHYQTALKNNMQYASYVNDGHRMDKHFTVHVAIEGGDLVGKPDGTGGLVVGTKTSYIPGLYMKEKGMTEYSRVVRFELDKAVRGRFK
jgi:hypothetical protein